MQLLSHLQRGIVLGFVIIVLLSVAGLVLYYYSDKEVLSETDTVTVSGSIPHIITIQIKPESRIPPTGNDDLPLIVEIRNVGSVSALKSYSVVATSTGDAYLGTISLQDIPIGTYDIAIKGLSHLRSVFSSQDFTGSAVRTYTLTTPNLAAGDANPTADNYVNSMDISYLSLNIYSSDPRADLTSDGIVNSLDYAALIKNIYKYGDN